MTEVSQSTGAMHEELERLKCRIEELKRDAQSRAAALAKQEEWQRFQEAILETTGALISVLDTNHKFIFWNKGAEALTGYDRSEVLGGKGVLQTIYPDESYREKVAHYRNEVIAGRPMDDLQLDVITKDGRHVTLAFYARGIHDAAGKPAGLVNVAIDVTARKQAEAALRVSEERFRSLFESLSEGVAIHQIIYDAEGAPVDYEILDVNPAYEKHTTIPRDKAIGQRASVLYGLGTAPFLDEYSRVAETGQSATLEVYFDPIGRHYRILATSPAKGRFATLFEDVTPRKVTEERLKERNAQLEALRNVGLDITSQLSREAVLRSITDRAILLFSADAGELYLYRAIEQDVERVVAIGSDKGDDRQLAAAAALAKIVADERRPVIRTDDDGAPVPWRSALGVPIQWRDEFLGVLTLLANTDGAFEERHFETAEMFATHAALAIVNARLYEEVQSLATSDELTGVLNRRALLSMGTREFERARRMQRPLTMLFVDLDGLKEINDRFSHEIGDRVLQEVTQRIRKSIRAVDVLARIGGDEFVVMLIETSVDGATDVAERLRQAVESIRLVTEHGLAGVTVSIGLAGASPDVKNLEALIRRADQAMYAAKQGGRNRVIVLET